MRPFQKERDEPQQKTTSEEPITDSLWQLSKRNPKFFSFSTDSPRVKPKASEVLTSYLNQTGEPPWTSYFVKYKDVEDDQFGMSYFNWSVGQSNYNVLRVGCFPFIKYHCTKGPTQDLNFEDKFYRFIKVVNLGIPCFMYGMAALFLVRHEEIVHVNDRKIVIYFLIKEDLGSRY